VKTRPPSRRAAPFLGGFAAYYRKSPQVIDFERREIALGDVRTLIERHAETLNKISILVTVARLRAVPDRNELGDRASRKSAESSMQPPALELRRYFGMM
jgi:hypothetical protein